MISRLLGDLMFWAALAFIGAAPAAAAMGAMAGDLAGVLLVLVSCAGVFQLAQIVANHRMDGVPDPAGSRP